MKTFDELVKQWLELQESGKVEEAQKLYDSELFDNVINRFVEKHSHT